MQEIEAKNPWRSVLELLLSYFSFKCIYKDKTLPSKEEGAGRRFLKGLAKLGEGTEQEEFL